MAASERKGGGSYGWFFKSQRERYIDLYGIHAFAPTPVLLPRKSHGWRGLVGCSPWGHKELDVTECACFFQKEAGMT